MMQELVPCLQLVAPVGMSLDDQDTWFEAAMKALSGIPVGLLQRGAAAAMRKAEHHSKIVPAIMAEIDGDWQWRKKNRAAAGSLALPAPAPATADTPTSDEIAAICRRFGVGRFSPHQPSRDAHESATVATDADPARPCRAPSREDYIRLFGVDPAAATDGHAEAA